MLLNTQVDPKNIAVLIRCYHATQYLPIVLKTYSWVDKILIMNYRFKSVEPRPDNTSEIAFSMNLPQLEVERGEGLEQHEILNRGLKILQDYKHVFIADADEIILPEDQQKIAESMATHTMDLGFMPIRDYFYDCYHCLPPRPGPALVIVNPKLANFILIRHVRSKSTRSQVFGKTLHHFGFALDVDTLNWKLKWESIEERVDVPKNLRNTKIETCDPPQELLDLLYPKDARAHS